MSEEQHITEQVTASLTEYLHSAKIDEMVSSLDAQDIAYKAGLYEIFTAREFIENPSHILGSSATKHGEVAEQLEVGIRRSFDALHQRSFSATFDGVGRLDPQDYKIDGIDVQSKFNNGARNTIDAIHEHFGKYQYWGSSGEYYQVPKDQYEQLTEIMGGLTPDGLSDRTAATIRSEVQSLALKMGKTWDESIRPGLNSYPEVQLRAAGATLDRVETSLHGENEKLKDQIRLESQSSIKDAAKSAAAGAFIAAGLNLGYGLYKKQKAGHSIFQLKAEDWKELGFDSAKAGIEGGITGAAIYGLTSVVGMPAPLAGAVASTARGVISQIVLYKKGAISQDVLADNCMALSSEAGLVTICAILGQATIPIPILGSVVGSVAGKFVAGILSDSLGQASDELVNRLRSESESALEKLGEEHRQLVVKIIAELSQLGGLMDFAFDPQNNASLVKLSISLAESLDVPYEEIIHDRNELDQFMLS